MEDVSRRNIGQDLTEYFGNEFLWERKLDIRANAVRLRQAKREPSAHADALHDNRFGLKDIA